MKLRALSLYNVGKHNGPVLDHLPDGMTIVFGPNEAGKSTILAGLRGVLFGKTIIADNAALVGQAARGTATFELDGVQGLWSLERVLTAAGRGRSMLTSPTGESYAGDAAIREAVPVLGLVEDLIYRSVFTFQLAELEGIEQLNQNLHRRIYTVGLLGSHSPVEIEQMFTAKARDIYSPDGRARNAKLRQCLARLAEARSQEANRSDTPEAYMELTRKLAVARDSLVRGIRAREVEIDARRLRLRKDVELYPIHVRIVLLTAELKQFDGVPRITGAQRETVSASTAALEQIERQLNQDIETYEASRREHDRVVINQRALGLAADLQALYRQASGVEEQLRHIAALDQELAELRRVSRSLRGQMSVHMTDEMVSGGDFGSLAIDEAKRYGERLQAAAYSRDTATQEAKRCQELATPARGGLPDSWQAESIADLELESGQMEADLTALENDAALLGELRERLVALDRLRSDRDGREKHVAVLLEHSHSGRGAVLAVLAVAACLLAALGVTALLHGALVAGLGTIVVGLALFVSGFVWLGRVQPRAAVDSVAEAKRELARCDHELARVGAEIGELQKALVHVTVESPDASGLVQAHSELAAKKRALEAEQKRVAETRERHGRWLSRIADREEASARQRQAVWDYEELCKSWRAFLQGFGLSGFPCAAQPFLEEARLVKEWRENRDDIAHKQQVQESDAQRVIGFIESVRRVLALLSDAEGEGGEAAATLAANADRRELDVAFSRLQTQLELALRAAQEAQEADRKRRSLRDKLTDGERVIEAGRSALEVHRERRKQVFAALGVATREEFDQLDAIHLDRDRREKELQGERMRAYGICGDNDAYDLRAQALGGVTKEDLDAALVSVEAEWRQCRQEEEACIQDITTLEAELRSWSDGVEAMDTAWTVAALETERERLARSWAVYRTAEALIRSARETFERERQPQAMRETTEIFTRVTQGKYTQLGINVGEGGKPELVCTDSLQREWSLNQLSRGAKEQIYLAMRLALIRDYAHRKLVLPIVLDDPMVNFDQKRLREYMRILKQEARSRQMIYLTCHDTVLEAAAPEQGEIHVVRLE